MPSYETGSACELARGIPSAIDINALLHGILQLREPVYRTQGIELTAHFNREPLFVEGLRNQLEESFLRLLFCAEQARHPITIQTQSAGGHVLVYIEFGTADGLGELALVRHRASMGGINLLSLYLQQTW